MKQTPYRRTLASPGPFGQPLEPANPQKQELPNPSKGYNQLKPAKRTPCLHPSAPRPSPKSAHPTPKKHLLTLLIPLLALPPTSPQNQTPQDKDKDHKTQNRTPQNEAKRPRKERLKDPAKTRIQKLTALLGPRTALLRSPTFLLAGQQSQQSRLKQLLALLEATAQRFQELVQAPPPRYQKLNTRLEVIVFPDEAAFRRFATEHHPKMKATDGFHSPKDRRCYIFNFQHSKVADKARRALRQQEAPLIALRDKLARADDKTAPKLSRRIAAYEQDLARYADDQNRLLDQLTASTLIHEAAHQLTAATHLIPSSTRGLPTWLGEGWATIFEQLATHQDPATALGSHNPHRLAILLLPENAERLLHARELITSTKPPADAAAYAQIWALMNFILSRPGGRRQLLGFIDDAVEAAEEARADRSSLDHHDRLAIFRRRFKINIHELDAALRTHRQELADKTHKKRTDHAPSGHR